ncbi:MAG: hypothetical protein HBSAPP03_14430 [Phycisphaerae bacterium]|nr:MAG: hypothetical protein HBSAPP03_14430 [Phycisphaerae bacterium]
MIGSGALNTDRDVNLSNAAQNWGGVSFPFNARLSGAIAGNLTGAINPTSIVRLEVHGQVSGAISAAPVSGTAIGRLQLGSTTSAGTITSGDTTTGGDLVSIEVESGTLAGAVLVGGKLQVLDCAGDIVIAASPGIYARDGIDTIQAGDIAADIAASTGGSGDFNSIECDSFTGSLTGSNLATLGGQTVNTPGITIDGDLDGILSFGGNVFRAIHVTGEFLAGSKVEIGGTLSASITADGDVTEILVDGTVIRSGPGGEIVLGSVHGDVGRIESTLGFARDDLRSGPEVLFIGGRIDEILGGPPEGSSLSVISGLLAAPEVGTITARGGMQLDMALLDFDRIEVHGSFGWDDPSNEGNEICGDGVFVIGDYCGADLYLGASALFEGQIIINANYNDCSTPSVCWPTDAFYYDFIEPWAALDTLPYYDAIDYEVFGHFAVGLVPYYLHKTACTPRYSPDGYGCEETTTVLRTWPASHGGGERETIVLTHYGPVFDGLDGSEEDDPETNPYKILRCALVLC